MTLIRTLVILFAVVALSVAQAPKGADKKAAAAAVADLIDVNSAPVDVLKTLPGIGDAYADRIVKNRPYKGKNEIVSKAGVPQGTYDKIKDKIVARQK